MSLTGEKEILRFGLYRLVKVCAHEFISDEEYLKQKGSFALYNYGKPCLKCGSYFVGVSIGNTSIKKRGKKK